MHRKPDCRWPRSFRNVTRNYYIQYFCFIVIFILSNKPYLFGYHADFAQFLMCNLNLAIIFNISENFIIEVNF